MNLVLLGPPGAGKGTLAELLKNSHDLLHISTGDLLRDEMSNNSTLGLEAKAYIDKGELVPDKIVTDLVIEKVQSKSASKGYMLDGFPRTKVQAINLDKILDDIGRPLDIAVYMATSMKVIVQRITGRRVALKSRKVYHIKNRPPKIKGKCDVSGEDLVLRADDNEETVRKRMHVYLKNTLPIVQYYKSKGILKKFNANKDSEMLLPELNDLFDEHKKHN